MLSRMIPKIFSKGITLLNQEKNRARKPVGMGILKRTTKRNQKKMPAPIAVEITFLERGSWKYKSVQKTTRKTPIG
jgi:hypothetical protein